MKKLFLVLLFNSLTALVLHASSAVHYTDIALSGSGKPIANAPVRVCNEPVTQTGPCLPLATVYSDVGLSVQKTNPFTADVLGNIDFYYDSSSGKHIAVEVSCQAGIPGCGPQGATFTQRNICVFCGETMQVNDLFVATQPIFDFIEGTGIQLSGSDDPTNNRAKLLINSLGILHVLLGPQHTDTVPFSPPDIGGLIRGSLNNLWEHQPVAQIGEVYTLIDVGGGQPIGEWVFPNTLDTCTSVQVSGVESGCEHEINFLPGTNITSITAVDDSDNDRTNVTINAAGAGGVVCDSTAITNIYVDTAGSDITGDGSVGNPYATIQHALDVGVPAFVGQKYYIYLKTAATYAGFTYASRAQCSGGVQCGLAAPDFVGPFDIGVSVIGSLDGTFSDTWIINTPIIVDGLRLYLQGVEVSNGSIGLTAQNHAEVGLAAVNFQNNNLGLLAATWSQVYLIPGVYVNDDFATALATLSNFAASSDGFEVTEDSVITDSCPDGNNTPLGTELACVATGTGQFGLACIEGKKGQIYMRDDVLVDLSAGVDTGTYGVKSLDSHFAMASYTYLGNAGNGKGFGILGGRVSGGALGGGVYSVTTAAIGALFQEGGELDDLPSFASVTKNFSSPYDATKAGTNFVGYGGTVFVTPFSATPTFDMQNSTTQKITLTGAVTASTFINGVDGMTLTMQICQDGGGAHTFAWDVNVLGADTIGATGSKCNVQRFMYDGIATKWYAIAPMQKNM